MLLSSRACTSCVSFQAERICLNCIRQDIATTGVYCGVYCFLSASGLASTIQHQRNLRSYTCRSSLPRILRECGGVLRTKTPLNINTKRMCAECPRRMPQIIIFTRSPDPPTCISNRTPVIRKNPRLKNPKAPLKVREPSPGSPGTGPSCRGLRCYDHRGGSR